MRTKLYIKPLFFHVLLGLSVMATGAGCSKKKDSSPQPYSPYQYGPYQRYPHQGMPGPGVPPGQMQPPGTVPLPKGNQVLMSPSWGGRRLPEDNKPYYDRKKMSKEERRKEREERRQERREDNKASSTLDRIYSQRSSGASQTYEIRRTYETQSGVQTRSTTTKSQPVIETRSSVEYRSGELGSVSAAEEAQSAAPLSIVFVKDLPMLNFEKGSFGNLKYYFDNEGNDDWEYYPDVEVRQFYSHDTSQSHLLSPSSVVHPLSIQDQRYVVDSNVCVAGISGPCLMLVDDELYVMTVDPNGASSVRTLVTKRVVIPQEDPNDENAKDSVIRKRIDQMRGVGRKYAPGTAIVYSLD